MLFSFPLKAASIVPQPLLPPIRPTPSYSRLNLSGFSSPFVLPSRNHAFYSPFFFSKAAPNHTMFVPFSPISGKFPLTSNFVRLKRSAKDDLHLPPKPLPDSKSIFPNKSRHPFAYAMRQFPNPLPIRLLSAPTQRTPDFSAKDNIHSKRSRFLLNFSSVVPTSFSRDRCLRSS